jgi:hypothetical protein
MMANTPLTFAAMKLLGENIAPNPKTQNKNSNHSLEQNELSLMN